jgi:polyribonucleotide nucleotidyltransferase
VLIGPGGKTIRGIIEQTGVTIDVTDDGTVLVGSPDGEALKQAVSMIELVTATAEVGKTYQGTVKRIEPYGAFLEVLPGQDGLLHISDFDWKRIENVEDVVKMGETMEVMITNVDRDGKIRLSRKELLPKPEGYVEPPPRPPGDRGDRDRGPRRGGDRGPRRGGGGSGERSRW